MIYEVLKDKIGAIEDVLRGDHKIETIDASFTSGRITPLGP